MASHSCLGRVRSVIPWRLYPWVKKLWCLRVYISAPELMIMSQKIFSLSPGLSPSVQMSGYVLKPLWALVSRSLLVL